MRDSTLPRGCLLLLMLVAATFLVDAASQVSIITLDTDLKFINPVKRFPFTFEYDGK